LYSIEMLLKSRWYSCDESGKITPSNATVCYIKEIHFHRDNLIHFRFASFPDVPSSFPFIFRVHLFSPQHLLRKSVTKRVGNGVADTTVGASSKSSSALADGCIVEHAVKTALSSVLSKNERVEVLASGCGLADSGTHAGVVRLVVVGGAKVSGGVVDGTSEHISWGEAGNWGGGGVDEVVTVWAGNDNLELGAVLTEVRCGSLAGRHTPEGALDGDACNRVGTGVVVGRVERRVTLVEDVEWQTGANRVTVSSARLDIVGVEVVEPKVASTSHWTVIVDECTGVSLRSSSGDGDGIVDGIVLETRDGVGPRIEALDIGSSNKNSEYKTYQGKKGVGPFRDGWGAQDALMSMGVVELAARLVRVPLVDWTAATARTCALVEL
jgi:hypothetical protein